MIVLPYEPLSRHTALRTGGPCGAFVYAHDDVEVATVVRDTRRAEWKLRVLGAGTRVVARDGGAANTVVMRLAGELERVDWGEDGFAEVGAGVLLPDLVARAANAGWGGLAAFADTPGTLGASLSNDPGWDDLVDCVYVLSRDARKRVPKAEVRDGALVLGARLRLVAGDVDALRRSVAERWLGTNPPGSRYGVPTGKPRRGQRTPSVREVLASVTLPLVRLRGIAVPGSAPELLYNLGSGTAADAALLHKSALERVEKVRGIELVSRIEWFGQD